MKVHRWQPSGKTPCGRNIADVQTNIGYYLSDGVTCESCHKATTFLSIMGDDWNGQSYGYLSGTTRGLWEADLDGNCPSKSELGRKEEYMRTFRTDEIPRCMECGSGKVSMLSIRLSNSGEQPVQNSYWWKCQECLYSTPGRLSQDNAMKDVRWVPLAS